MINLCRHSSGPGARERLPVPIHSLISTHTPSPIFLVPSTPSMSPTEVWGGTRTWMQVACTGLEKIWLGSDWQAGAHLPNSSIFVSLIERHA